MKSGTEPYIGKPYGNPNRPGGQRVGKARHARLGSDPHATKRSTTSSATSGWCCPARTRCPRSAPPRGPPARRPGPDVGQRPPHSRPQHGRTSRGARGRRWPGGRRDRVLARAPGHDVLVVEKKTFPREKTCGDGLTPRAVRQLHDMGLAERLTDFHRFDGLRALAHGITLELEWPEHPDLPSYGYVVRRRDLDQMVADNAVKAGATVWQGTEATAPILERGLVRGASASTDEEVRGEVRGRRRRRQLPLRSGPRHGATIGRIRRAWRSAATARARSTPTRGSSRALDVKDRNGNTLPGYGWIFPVGDGTVNVGVGLLSTFRDFKA